VTARTAFAAKHILADFLRAFSGTMTKVSAIIAFLGLDAEHAAAEQHTEETKAHTRPQRHDSLNVSFPILTALYKLDRCILSIWISRVGRAVVALVVPARDLRAIEPIRVERRSFISLRPARSAPHRFPIADPSRGADRHMAGVGARVATIRLTFVATGIAVAIVLGALVPTTWCDSAQAWHRGPILHRLLILVLLLVFINAVTTAGHEPNEDAAHTNQHDEGARNIARRSFSH